MYLKTENQILTVIISPKIHTSLLWDLSLLFVTLGGLYFLFIFFFRNKLSKLALRTKGKRNELAPIISNFLFHSPEDPKDEQKEYVQLKIEIREYLAHNKFRKIIAQVLFDLQKDVAGGTRERLFRLYKELELHHDAFEKLKSWRWEVVAQGILELSQMEVAESYQLIRKFINDRRGVVRKQAELAIVGLKTEGIEYLLDSTTHTISEWQQLKLIETLGKIKNYRPPQFKAWLLSQNKDVVLFALRLIKKYNQNGAEASINELVKHKNDEIKIAAIQCIMDFNFTDSLHTLKNVYWNVGNSVKISMLNAIAYLGTEHDLIFLDEVTKKEKNFMVFGKAQSAINTIKPDTILPTKDIVEPKEPKNEEGVGNPSDLGSEDVKNLIVKFEEVDAPEEESIEVEDIEFFDEIEIPQPKKEIVIEEIAPAFEINSIEEEFGSAMDHLLGAVASHNLDYDSNNLLEHYDTISTEEKSKLLRMLEDSGDQREIPLLEHIAENEEDAELRFAAFKIMKSITSKDHSIAAEKENDTTSAVSLEEQSVFYPLYQHASDLDSRLLLIRQAMEIGDDKEIPFLKSLLTVEDRAIKKTAKKGLQVLKNKCHTEIPVPKSQITHSDVHDKTVRVDEEMEQNQQQKDSRIPLELLFLYEELGINTAHKNVEGEGLFDFDLSDDFFQDSTKHIAN